jgi:NifU-like protein involved in Fe-S cluster formation
MIDDLYNTDVLSLASNIAHIGSLDAPDASVRKVSKLCGSWVEVDINATDGIVIDFAIRLQACALGQASASILAENVIGASLEELTKARDELEAMLKSGGKAPAGRFSKLGLLKEVAKYPARHTSTLLAYNAVIDALESL